MSHIRDIIRQRDSLIGSLAAIFRIRSSFIFAPTDVQRREAAPGNRLAAPTWRFPLTFRGTRPCMYDVQMRLLGCLLWTANLPRLQFLSTDGCLNCLSGSTAFCGLFLMSTLFLSLTRKKWKFDCRLYFQ